MTVVDPTKPMLKIALNTSRTRHEFLLGLLETSEILEVQHLLITLAESESRVVEKLLHMIATGVLDEIEYLADVGDKDSLPDSTPFDLSRNETDPRIFICNRILEESLKTYTLYLRLATRSKSEVVSRLFEYLAYVEKTQIDELRRIGQRF